MTFMKHLRRLAVGLGLLGAFVACPAAAEPAMWVIRDEDSTIYLFGTVHVMKPGVAWRTPKIDKAMAESAELVLEIPVPDNQAAMQPLILKYGLDLQAPLSSKLTPAERASLAGVAQELGLPPQALEPMRPWMAGLTLSVVALTKAGYDPESGVEKRLDAEARTSGKTRAALETFEQQIRYFADMPREAELAFLRSTLDDVTKADALLATLVGAWAAGDVRGLETAFLDQIRRASPTVYEVLIKQRNQRWAAQLKEKLAGSGVSFVAVGAGHLVGPDSVQAELAKLGVAARPF